MILGWSTHTCVDANHNGTKILKLKVSQNSSLEGRKWNGYTLGMLLTVMQSASGSKNKYFELKIFQILSGFSHRWNSLGDLANKSINSDVLMKLTLTKVVNFSTKRFFQSSLTVLHNFKLHTNVTYTIILVYYLKLFVRLGIDWKSITHGTVGIPVTSYSNWNIYLQ